MNFYTCRSGNGKHVYYLTAEDKKMDQTYMGPLTVQNEMSPFFLFSKILRTPNRENVTRCIHLA